MLIENATALSATALLGFYAAMQFLMAAFRTGWSLTRSKPANTFDPAGGDVGAFGQRLTRVHANTYEAVPFYIAVLLLSISTGKTEITDGLAPWLVVCRIGQACTHLVSGGVAAVLVRALIFFAPQLAILTYWVARMTIEFI